MKTVELIKDEILEEINLGKIQKNFNTDMGDYVKVELMTRDDIILHSLYSNRILFKYPTDDYYFGEYNYDQNDGFMSGRQKSVESQTLIPQTIETLSGASDVYKKHFEVYKDEDSRIYIKPNDIIKLASLPEDVYKLKVYFLRNILSDLSVFLESQKSNYIENGNFFAGLEATQTGDLDRSVGKNNFIFMDNPGLSRMSLEQDGISTNNYSMRITGIKPNTTYVITCWVAFNSTFSGESGIFSIHQLDHNGQQINSTGTGLKGWEFDSKVAGGLTWKRMYLKYNTVTNSDEIILRIGAQPWMYQSSPSSLSGRRYVTDIRCEEFDTSEFKQIASNDNGLSINDYMGMEEYIQRQFSYTAFTATSQTVVAEHSFVNGAPPPNVAVNDGVNNIVEFAFNPGQSEFVLEQDGSSNTQYIIAFDDIKPNTTYLASAWVAKDENYNGSMDIFVLRASNQDLPPNVDSGYGVIPSPNNNGGQVNGGEGSIMDYQSLTHPDLQEEMGWERRGVEIQTNGTATGRMYWFIGHQPNSTPNTDDNGKRYITGITLTEVQGLWHFNPQDEDPIWFEDYDLNGDGNIDQMDMTLWSNAGRQDIIPRIQDIIVGNIPTPPSYLDNIPTNQPVYFEDYDLNHDGGLNVLDAVGWVNRGEPVIAEQVFQMVLGNEPLPPHKQWNLPPVRVGMTDVTTGVPHFFIDRNLTTFDHLSNASDNEPAGALWGPYSPGSLIKVNDEIMKITSFGIEDLNNNGYFPVVVQRAQNGTSAATHAIGDEVLYQQGDGTWGGNYVPPPTEDNEGQQGGGGAM